MPSFNRIIDWVLRATWCLAFVFAPASLAQTESEVWFGFGLGMGELFEEGEENDRVGGAFAGVLYANYQTGAHLLGVRSAAATELTGDHVFDIGALYGRATTDGRGHVSFGIGLAVVSVDRNPDNDINIDACLLFCGVDPDSDDRPDDDEGSAFTVGVPLELQLFVRPRSLSSFGFGVYVFANVNLESPFVGATVSLQVGRFR